MAFPFKGNTNSSAFSEAIELPSVVTNYYLANRSLGDISVNVYLISGIYQISMIPFGLLLNQGDFWEDKNSNIVVLATEQIKVQVSGSLDYNFTFENTEPPNIPIIQK